MRNMTENEERDKKNVRSILREPEERGEGKDNQEEEIHMERKKQAKKERRTYKGT